MGLIDFFRKGTKPVPPLRDQSTDAAIGERLTEIGERMRKVETRLKETSLQLDEIDAFLRDGNADEYALVNAFIALSDTIEDFYHFTDDGEDTPLFEQAQMMWHAVKSAAESARLERLEGIGEPFDFRRFTVEGTAYDDRVPNGTILKTLKSGYAYKNEIIRRASVIVNKAETPNLEPSGMAR